jgi:hypothetical protein
MSILRIESAILVAVANCEPPAAVGRLAAAGRLGLLVTVLGVKRLRCEA